MDVALVLEQGAAVQIEAPFVFSAQGAWIVSIPRILSQTYVGFNVCQSDTKAEDVGVIARIVQKGCFPLAIVVHICESGATFTEF